MIDVAPDTPDGPEPGAGSPVPDGPEAPAGRAEPALAPSDGPAPVAGADPGRRRLEALGERIARLSAHITAATGRLLALIRAFDEAEGWAEAGFGSCARWLAWRTGVGPGAAREKVRVARALGELPVLRAAMGRGELSYSMARAITRVATPETEAGLVETARHATVAEMERLVRAWRDCDRTEAAELEAEALRHATRELTLVPTGDGGWRITGRLDPEVGALLARALEAAEEALYRRERAEAPDGEREGAAGEADPEAPASAPARRADAMGLVAEAALGEGLGAEAGEEAPVVGRAGRFEVVVHLDAATLAGEKAGASTPTGTAPRDVSAGTPAGPHLEDGPALAAATARRIACEAGIVPMVHGPGGETLDVGRRSRSVPAPLRRALEHRDGGCVFPGCGSRFCDAHHLIPWAEGGATALENLALLCRRHHRLVHEEGWTIERADGEEAGAPSGEAASPGPVGAPRFRFTRPDGRDLPRVPDPPPVPERPVRALARAHRGRGIDGWTATPSNDEHRLEVDWALFTLRRPATLPERERAAEEGPGTDPVEATLTRDVPAGTSPAPGETKAGGGGGSTRRPGVDRTRDERGLKPG